tara:strand:+ start:2318 stop:3295 length:978 start_codon:yes stop_codon:yes gene_type:complete
MSQVTSNKGPAWGTAEEFDAALDAASGNSGESVDYDSDESSVAPADEDDSIELGASGPDEESAEVDSVDNPYDGDAIGARPEEDHEDGGGRSLQNLKAELDRKIGNRDRQLDNLSQQNSQLVGVIQELRQMLVNNNPAPPPPPPKDPYADLDEMDPDYETQVLRVDMKRMRDELSRMRSEKEDQERQAQESHRMANYQRWVQETVQGFVEGATKGSKFADNNDVKARLWEAGYTHLGAIGADPNRIEEVRSAVNGAFLTFDSIYKQAQEAAVGKVKTKRSGRRPVKGRGSAASKVVTKAPDPAKLSKKEFGLAVDAWLEANIPSG